MRRKTKRGLHWFMISCLQRGNFTIPIVTMVLNLRIRKKMNAMKIFDQKSICLLSKPIPVQTENFTFRKKSKMTKI